MGSFAGHVIPGTLFLLVGLWHLRCGIKNYLAAPQAFVSRMWHPAPLPGHWSRLELYIIVAGSFLDMTLVELGIGTGFRPIENGGVAPGHLNNFEHASMLLMFFVLGCAVLVSETTSLLPLPLGALHVLAALAFLCEGLLFSLHSTTHSGAEPRYHLLLALCIAACVACALLAAACPRSFLLDAFGSGAIALQGLWFWQTAMSLYGPLIPSGCYLQPNTTLRCDSEEIEHRGTALAVLQFIALLASILVLCLVYYGVAARTAPQPSLDFIRATHAVKCVEGKGCVSGNKAEVGLVGVALHEEEKGTREMDSGGEEETRLLSVGKDNSGEYNSVL
ncbi:hypothetical protein CLOP_g4459 [Closterium sp. NIES-67]|nr:hypothetical protein CLOP_g4459 [Closterium sp. NIES-67]